MRPVLAGVDTYPCPILLKLLNKFLVQKRAICRKINVNAPLPTPSHNFSTTYRQQYVEKEKRIFGGKIKKKTCIKIHPSLFPRPPGKSGPFGAGKSSGKSPPTPFLKGGPGGIYRD